MGHAALSIGGAHCHVHDVDRMRRPHDALIEYGYVHVQFVEIDILLVVHADKVMKGMPGNGKHRLLVALGVIEAVE